MSKSESEIQHDNTMRIMTEFRHITKVTPRFDGMMSVACGKKVIDIFKLDEDLAKADSDYDNERALYKGHNVSMQEYILQRFGERAAELARQMV